MHGEKGNVAFKMATEHGLLMDSIVENLEGGQAFIEESGSLIDENIALKFLKIYDEIIKSAESVLENYTGSLGEYFEEE